MAELTNKLITDFKYDPKKDSSLGYGYAKQRRMGFCYCTKDGEPIPTAPMGEEAYSVLCARVKALCAPFIAHLQRIFINDPRDVDIFLDYMAFKQQYSGKKVRWALVVAGEQGVGKDVAIDACWKAYGEDRVKNVTPASIMSEFNDYLNGALLLRISEAADLGESNRWVFNEKVKVIIAGHPDVMQVNPKYGLKYWMKMHHGTIITTNHLEDGFYIPKRDRRYYVIKCATWKELGLDEEQGAAYFDKLFDWFNTTQPCGFNGFELIGMYLFYYRNVENFQCSTCPKPTAAKMEVISASAAVPFWFSDCLASYAETILGFANDKNEQGDPSLTSPLYGTSEGFPLIIRTRSLNTFLNELAEENAADKSEISKASPAKIAALLRKMNYERVSPEEGRHWRFSDSHSTRIETFYFNSNAIDKKTAQNVLKSYGGALINRLDGVVNSVF